MEKYLTIRRKIISVLFADMATAGALLAARGSANVIKSLRTVRAWLNSTHDFFPEDGDPVTCTGWQFVFISSVMSVVCVLLGIQW